MANRFLTRAEVIEIHDELVNTFGGGQGIRDESALLAALARPQTGNYDGLVVEAAEFMDGLFNYRPFLDGNKRTATGAGEVFLRRNGHVIDCPIFEAYEFFMDLFDEDAFLFDNLEPWLRERVKPVLLP